MGTALGERALPLRCAGLSTPLSPLAVRRHLLVVSISGCRDNLAENLEGCRGSLVPATRLFQGRYGFHLQWLPARVTCAFFPDGTTQRVRRLPKLPLLLRPDTYVRALPLSSMTCSARTLPSTIMRHRLAIGLRSPATERSSVFNDIHQIIQVFRVRNTVCLETRCQYKDAISRGVL